MLFGPCPLYFQTEPIYLSGLRVNYKGHLLIRHQDSSIDIQLTQQKEDLLCKCDNKTYYKTRLSSVCGL